MIAVGFVTVYTCPRCQAMLVTPRPVDPQFCCPRCQQPAQLYSTQVEIILFRISFDCWFHLNFNFSLGSLSTIGELKTSNWWWKNLNRNCPFQYITNVQRKILNKITKNYLFSIFFELLINPAKLQSEKYFFIKIYVYTATTSGMYLRNSSIFCVKSSESKVNVSVSMCKKNVQRVWSLFHTQMRFVHIADMENREYAKII